MQVATLAFLVNVLFNFLEPSFLIKVAHSVTSMLLPSTTRYVTNRPAFVVHILIPEKMKVRLIWPAKLSLTKVIFYLNRYVCFATIILGIYGRSV